MALESLLKPVKWIDEQILKQYTKIAEKFNLEENKRKYKVSLGLEVASIVAVGLGLYFMCSPNYEVPPYNAIFAFSACASPDIAYTLEGLKGKIQDDINSDAGNINLLHYMLREYNSVTRLPIFVSGAGFVIKSLVDLIQKDFDYQSAGSLGLGLSFLCLASSMYIKDSDPKLLDKEPALKKAYKWIIEKAKSLVPEPVPQPGYMLPV